MRRRATERPDWRATALWKTLERRSRGKSYTAPSALLSNIVRWLDAAEKVLTYGGTSPTDFTLHDDQHAFRVAERMVELIGPDVYRSMSDVELALLLLSAYCHDIGMTPERGKVQSHYRHLFDPDQSGLDEAAAAEFQRFLDEYQDLPIAIPLCTSTPTVDDVNLAEELTAFYVRHKHNDWSAEWITAHLDGELPGLTDWKETLVLLCRSHHFGFAELKGPAFDPRPAGQPPQILHLRYLACVLRLADILENDPERTPQVIYRHRSIEERKRSVVHWQKDHDLTLDIQDRRILFHARPRSARVHKALLQLTDAIDHELHGIAQFGEKLPSLYQVGKRQIRREWNLASAVVRDIEAASGTYEYIEGAFRPNTSRLLQLLSGEQLYGDALAAVRELLQNGFDAVREKIARRRLQPHVDKRDDPALAVTFGNEERVTLTLEVRKFDRVAGGETQIWLVCEDSGVGLTKPLITGHLLVSGQSRRHDVLELERRCAEAGFPLGRTGQFGVGVLSYFMLASEVHFTTVRFQDCGDLDAAGWHFTTSGVGDFGELRRLDRSPLGTSGTRVEWRLRKEKSGTPEEFSLKLLNYLKETIVRLPCAFRYQVRGLGTDQVLWDKKTGWTETEDDVLSVARSEWVAPNKLALKPAMLLTSSEVELQAAVRELYPSWLKAASDALRCEFREVGLPDGFGSARLSLPFFQMPDGRCLVFPLKDDKGHIYDARTEGRYSSQVDGLTLSTEKRAAWKGIATHVHLASPLTYDEALWPKRPCGMTVDLTGTDAALLHVSRSGVTCSRAVANQLRRYLDEQYHTFADEVLSARSSGRYVLLNTAVRGGKLALKDGASWSVASAEGKVFAPVSFPAVAVNTPVVGALVRADGTAVTPLLAGASTITASRARPIWPAPARIVALEVPAFLRRAYLPVPFWDSAPDPAKSTDSVPFPPEWENVITAAVPGGIYYDNLECPLLQLISEDRRRELRAASRRHTTPWSELSQASTPELAAWFLMRAAFAMRDFEEWNEWEKVEKSKNPDLQRTWSLIAEVCSSASKGFYVWRGDNSVLLRAGKSELGFFSVGPLLPAVTRGEWLVEQAPVNLPTPKPPADAPAPTGR